MYPYFIFFFFFNDTATTEIYTLSLHDALPISIHLGEFARGPDNANMVAASPLIRLDDQRPQIRSEEHTSELQSRSDLVCRLLLEKKKKDKSRNQPSSTRSPQHTVWRHAGSASG